VQEMQFEAKGGEAPRVSARQGLQALMFLAPDERQLVQLRPQGYSFNRLAPYASLDHYLPEIERTWKLFVEWAAPVQVRLIRLRFINRILLPSDDGSVNLDNYLKLGPRLPDAANLTFSGFFNQHSAVESATGNAVNITMATQPLEDAKLPVILDIEAYQDVLGELAGDGEHLDRLTLSTLHIAQGREFWVVFMFGMDVGRLPRNGAGRQQLAEARRLFYVGFTRAKAEVHLVHTMRRASPFVDEIEQHLAEEQ